MSAARIYRVRGGAHHGRWFWAVQIALVASHSTAGWVNADGGREAREACEAILRAMGDP
jgi:hypothetical protein